VILEFVALAVMLIIGATALYVVFEMREVYADHREKFLRVITAVEESQRLVPEIVSSVGRLESDGNALQEVALQMERMIAEIRTSVAPSLTSAADRQVSVLDDLGDHLDWQKSKLTEVLENISAELRNLSESRTQQPGRPPGNGEYVRIDRGALGADERLRFKLLKDWVHLNSLSIVHRASRQYTSANQLISAIPDYLQAEAEVLEDRVLLIGTRNHSERLAIPIKDIEPTCRFRQWFDISLEGPFAPEIPAVLARANGSFDVSQKGITHRLAA
jgi:hypothetical protein